MGLVLVECQVLKSVGFDVEHSGYGPGELSTACSEPNLES